MFPVVFLAITQEGRKQRTQNTKRFFCSKFVELGWQNLFRCRVHCRQQTIIRVQWLSPEVRTGSKIPSAMAFAGIRDGTLPEHNHCLPKPATCRYVFTLNRVQSINAISWMPLYTSLCWHPQNIHTYRYIWNASIKHQYHNTVSRTQYMVSNGKLKCMDVRGQDF